ncbi:hypothetical protein QL112_011060 [Xenorhabdus griffiniae]|uniref:Uncharacterized protein n=1 Tax=Xenorhabdus griffiniae TaxID=351672 RepID=A0ABY9XCY0_9GAMM|nr:hypothetical protein [Xenorhabdus griffiniae]WMV70774.1 hypothetical protein QL128_11055 [Xenorhabdus griffiniae]WNH00450.1 hypothetical protein QL112_011060 [Xenorhabdus griffiniae]
MNSDTELVLADNVAVTLNNTQYQIQVTVPDSASDAVWHIVANTTYTLNSSRTWTNGCHRVVWLM